MLRKKLFLSVLVGLALTLPLTGINYLANQAFDLPFFPFTFFNWMVPLIPGPIITFGIDSMIDTMLFLKIDVANSAKTAEQVMAISMFIGLATVVGASAYALLSDKVTRAGRIVAWGLVAAFSLFLISVSLSETTQTLAVLGISALLALWMVGIGWVSGKKLSPVESVVDELPGEEPEIASVEQLNRRQFLITLGTASAAITIVGSGLGVLLAADQKRRLGAANGGYIPSHTLPNADDPLIPASGTRLEYTPIPDHYKVFLELEPTVIEAAGYILPIGGMVNNPLNLSLDDIRTNFDSFDQYVTLSCISGRVGTTLIGTTKWTGVPLQDILAEAGVQPEARYLYIESGDGFYETIPLDLIENDRRIMLAHSWDEAPIPSDHGFPLRVWIPDRFGMKQPKWIVSMELTDEDRPGYWVERGWDKLAQVKTTSVIDTVAVEDVGLKDGSQVIPVGGIAWAGDRQISAVAVRVDGGDWQPAELRTPLSETTWVIWRYDWPFASGEHTFEVKCFEADGTAQIEEEAPARPSGSTGLHTREAQV